MTKEVDIGRRESACSRWPVLVSCFFCHLTIVSVSYHAGVLHVALLDTYGQSVVATAWLGSVYTCLPYLVGPLASIVINSFDLRTCLIVAGLMAAVGSSSCFFVTQFPYLYPALILAGTGQGFAMTASYVAINYNFPSQANILIGICVCGSGLGIFIHPPLLQVMVDKFGLHGAMLVIGAISLNSVACGMAVPPSPYEKHLRLARKQRRHQGTSTTLAASLKSHRDVITDFRFLVFLLTGLGFSSGLACYYLYLPDFLLHSNYDAMTASFVLSATGMGSIPSRLLTGGATNDDNIDATTFFFGIHAMAAVATLLVPFTVGSVVSQMVLAVVFGVYTGAAWASYSPLLLELLGVWRVANGVGLYLFTMGVGYVAGPPLAASLYTYSRNFHHVFYFTAAMFALASAASMLSMLVKKKDDVTLSLSAMMKAATRVEFAVESDANVEMQQKDRLLPHSGQEKIFTVVAEVSHAQGKDGVSKRSAVREGLSRTIDDQEKCVHCCGDPESMTSRQRVVNKSLSRDMEDQPTLPQCSVDSESMTSKHSVVNESLSRNMENQSMLPQCSDDRESMTSKHSVVHESLSRNMEDQPMLFQCSDDSESMTSKHSVVNESLSRNMEDQPTLPQCSVDRESMTSKHSVVYENLSRNMENQPMLSQCSDDRESITSKHSVVNESLSRNMEDQPMLSHCSVDSESMTSKHSVSRNMEDQPLLSQCSDDRESITSKHSVSRNMEDQPMLSQCSVDRESMTSKHSVVYENLSRNMEDQPMLSHCSDDRESITSKHSVVNESLSRNMEDQPMLSHCSVDSESMTSKHSVSRNMEDQPLLSQCSDDRESITSKHSVSRNMEDQPMLSQCSVDRESMTSKHSVVYENLSRNMEDQPMLSHCSDDCESITSKHSVVNESLSRNMEGQPMLPQRSDDRESMTSRHSIVHEDVSRWSCSGEDAQSDLLGPSSYSNDEREGTSNHSDDHESTITYNYSCTSEDRR